MKTGADEGDERSPEAIAIIGKLRKKRGGDSYDEGDGEGDGNKPDSGSASSESFTSAVEDLFRMFKGRDPKESETSELEDISRRLIANCDDGDEDDQ